MDRWGVQRPVFILGLTPRTGTNYLWDLLCLHPSCAPGREPIREDFFLEEAHLLARFVREVSEKWDPAWGTVGDETLAELRASLGTALLDFLGSDTHRRLVTKNPSVAGLAQVFAFFPTVQLIILIRDGRAVVESCVRTFGWDFDLAARRWAAAADTVMQFLKGRPREDPVVRLVRYEDLITDLRPQMTIILSYLGLEVADFDFSAAERLPVRGSSVFFGDRTQVHWDPVERTADFDPLRRSADWSVGQHRRFAWLAGRQQVALGYSLDEAVPATASARARQRSESARWRARRAMDMAEYRLRGRLGPLTQPLRQRLGLTRAS